MKKYIGTKEVSAQPMTAEEAVVKGYKVGNNNGDGYEVGYKDGYKSWSPKDAFEEAYLLAETHLDRMEIERQELSNRLFSLNKFIDGEKFESLDVHTQGMLKVQLQAMRNYMHVLCARSTRMECGKGSHTGFSFGVAIEYLRAGCAVRRRSWKDKDAFVVKQVPARIECNIIPKMQSLPQSAKDLILKGAGFINYTYQMLIINAEGYAASWLPTSEDVFAEDWGLICE